MNLINGKVKDLHYRIIRIDTHDTRIEIPQLRVAYNGRTEKDNELYDRKDPSKLEEYVENKIKRILN